MIQAFADLDAAASVGYTGIWEENDAWPIEVMQKTIPYPDGNEFSYNVKRLEDGKKFQAVLVEFFLHEGEKFYQIPVNSVLCNLYQVNLKDRSKKKINFDRRDWGY